MRAADVIDVLETLAPSRLAEEWDEVGLRAGDPQREVSRCALAMDVTPAVVAAAVEAKAEMLVSHHPAFFGGIRTLDETTPQGRLAAAVVRAGLVVWSAHTNLDIAEGGVNDCMAAALGLRMTVPLAPSDSGEPLRKIVVFVPPEHADAVRGAMCDAGAGVIGDYTDCAFQTPGTGFFRGGDGTDPFIGTAGHFETVEEMRVETVVPRGTLGPVLSALRDAHPYEEPAFDVYALDAAPTGGCGRVGDVESGTTLGAFASTVQDVFDADHVGLLGDGDTPVRRVAVWGGSGAPLSTAIRSGADVLVTGEMKYHDLVDAEDAGLAVVLLGHGASEAVVLPVLAERLGAALPDLDAIVLPRSWTELRAVR